LSADLGVELGASANDAIVLRVTRPTDIPADSLQGRRDDIGKSIRLTSKGTLARESMGEFSLAPAQGPVRAILVPLASLERDLAQPGRVNLLLVSGLPEGDAGAKAVRDALGPAMTADDLGLHIEILPSRTIVVEAASGVISDATAAAV